MKANWIKRIADQFATWVQVNCMPPIRVPIEDATLQNSGQIISRFEVRRKMVAKKSPVISSMTNPASG